MPLLEGVGGKPRRLSVRSSVRVWIPAWVRLPLEDSHLEPVVVVVVVAVAVVVSGRSKRVLMVIAKAITGL